MYWEDMFRDIKFTELISFSYDSESEVIVKLSEIWPGIMTTNNTKN